MREDERRAARRAREGLKLSSLILIAIGAALMVFLKIISPDMPVYLAGLFPLGVGVAMVIYILFVGPRVE